MIRLQIKRCHICKVRGLGPGAVKLLPMNGLLYCEKDWREQLDWEGQREIVLDGLKTDMFKAGFMEMKYKISPKSKAKAKDWRGYIQEHCDLAQWALTNNDRRSFVYYFTWAMYGWSLEELT